MAANNDERAPARFGAARLRLRSTRFRLLLIGILPLCATLPLAIRGVSDDIGRWRDDRAQVDAAAAASSLSPLRDALQREWFASLDLTRTTSADSVDIAALDDQRVTALAADVDERRDDSAADVDRAIGDANEILTRSIAEGLERLADVRTRIETGAVSPTEVDFTFGRLVSDIDRSLDVHLAVADRLATGPARATIEVKNATGALLVSSGEVRHQITLALDRLLSGQEPNWMRFDAAATEHTAQHRRAGDLQTVTAPQWTAALRQIDRVLTDLDQLADHTVDGTVDADLDGRIGALIDARASLAASDTVVADTRTAAIDRIVAVADGDQRAAQRALIFSVAMMVLATLLVFVTVARVGRQLAVGRAGAHDDEFAERRSTRDAVRTELMRALGSGELELWFQPVVDLRTGHAVSAEALTRWMLPDGSVRSPAEFIPVAEESGLIIELDRWVIDTACRNIATWAGTPLAGLEVAINVSARHLVEGDLVGTIIDSCQRWSVDSRQLAVEITESFLAADREAMRRVLERLHELGVTLLIDDFGTGYSSLAHLQELPFDVLKIDQAFVRRMGNDRTSRSIVEALVALGHTMQLTVLAEGVETQQTLDDLVALECDQVQGYFVAEPMEPGPALIDVCARRSTPRPAVADSRPQLVV